MGQVEFSRSSLGRRRRCDILVNSAGIGCLENALQKMEVKDWDDVLNTNLRAFST